MIVKPASHSKKSTQCALHTRVSHLALGFRYYLNPNPNPYQLMADAGKVQKPLATTGSVYMKQCSAEQQVQDCV